MATTVANLEVELSLDDKKLKRGLKSANTGISDFAGKVTGTNLGVLGIIAGIAGIGIASVDAAIKWESAFAGVHKTVDASATELQLLEDQLRDMATDTSNPLSALDNAAITLAQIAEMGGSLGIAIDDMDEFTQTVGMLAMTTDLTADAASTMIAQFANIVGMDSDDYDNFGSTLVDLGNKMAATEGQILEFAQRIAAAGVNAGFSEDEILAFSAAMASVGLNPEAGGSAFTQSINTIVKAVALGGPALDTLAETAGTTAEAFQTAWADDPAGALVDFLDGLGNMTPADRLTTLADLGLSGIRVTDTLSRLAGNTELVADALDVANVAWDENNALMTEAEKRAETTEGKMNTLKNNLNELGIQLGDALLPIVNDVTASLTDLISNLNSDPEGAANNFIDMAEDIADAITPMKDDIELPDFATVIDGWTKFFDSIKIIAETFGAGIGLALNTIAVGVRSFAREIDEITARASIADSDINMALGINWEFHAQKRDAALANVNAIESAEALEQQIRDSLGAGNLSIDMSEFVTTDPALLAQKLVDPALMQMAITQALTENDQAALSALVPIAMEMGLDVNDLYAQFEAAAIEAGLLGTAEITMMAAVTVNPASIDLSPIIAGINAAASGLGTGGNRLSSGLPQLDSGGMVTSDGVAMLHANERVLNPAETKAYESGGGSGGNTVININGVQDVDGLMYELRRRGIDLTKLAA